MRRLTALVFALMCCEAGGAWGGGIQERTVAPELPGRTGFTLLRSSATGLCFTNRLSDERAARNQIRLNGAGVALGDVDGDGNCDVYLCQLDGDNALFRNLGDWRFTNVTESAGVTCHETDSTGAVFADVDGDGDLDLLVGGIGRGVRLFMNDGRGRFTERTDSGLRHRFGATSLALADMDGDGDLDLYVANYQTSTIRSTGVMLLNVNGRRMIRPEDRDRLEITPDQRLLEHGEPDQLYRNLGDGRFEEVSWTDGTFRDEAGQALLRAPRDWGLSVVFRDLNGDGTPDLYVCNDFHSVDRVWLNDGTGHFRAAPWTMFRHTPAFSMSVDVADVNRDGFDDLGVADMLSRHHGRRLMQLAATEADASPVGEYRDRPQFDHGALQINRGDNTFADLVFYAGLEQTDWTWSLVFLDVDLDGFEDVLCACGHRFDTQDLDASARIDGMGPWSQEKTHEKVLHYPRMQQPKLAFHNQGNLKFVETGRGWGFDQVGVAHGMALADLDNDGDLDVVVNNLGEEAGVYRNDTPSPRLAVRLRGTPPNTHGIGARLRVEGGAVPVQTQSIQCGGRYLSADEPVRTFAAGSAGTPLRLQVTWPNGKRSVVEGLKANTVCLVEETGAVPAPAPTHGTNAPWFADVSELLRHRHADPEFDDFERQPLLPRKLSQPGPGVAWFDADNDGREDLVVGAGKGGSLAVFRNLPDGAFAAWTNLPVILPVSRDLTGIVGWYQGGRAMILAGASNYEDGETPGGMVRQYDLEGRRVSDAVPGSRVSCGPIALADMDGDGDVDLFVGGRSVPGRYPEPATSFVFRNDDGKFRYDTEASQPLLGVGLVSSAVWTDLDGDGAPDLVLACEWGPIRVFRNDRGRLREATEVLGLAGRTGWWTGLAAGDLDGDGRMDLVVGNWGLNTKYRATPAHPQQLYYGDLDEDGRMEAIEACYDEELGKEVPLRDLPSMTAGLPRVSELFETHHAYGTAGVAEILAINPQAARSVSANTLTTLLLLNRGTAFEVVPLPPEAQWSPVFGVAIADLDGDGHEDVFLGQNFFGNEPRTSRCDAGRGLLLQGDGKGGFRAIPGQESGVLIYGEQRGVALADYDEDGRVDLAVGQNGAETRLLRNTRARPGLRVRLAGPAGNPTAVGASIRLECGNQAGPLREIHAGSGFLSQDSPVQVLAVPGTPTVIRVRWPGGRTTTSPVPADAREIRVIATGEVAKLR